MPKPLYLAMATLPCLSSNAALESAKRGWLPWSGSLRPSAATLLKQLDGVNGNALHSALAQAGAERIAALAEGIDRFERQEYTRKASRANVLWQEGSSQLLDYGVAASGARHPLTILFVPSLINRAYIFDLAPDKSMIRFLKQQGFRCLLMDWGDPGEKEQRFGMADYTTRLECALESIPGKVMLAGYCMGGMMALAASLRKPAKVTGLALIGTPWDFHSPDAAQMPGAEIFAGAFEEFLSTNPVVPGALVYHLLYLANPWPVHEKYIRFATMEAGSEEYRAFMEREHWLRDGVALTAQCARTAFIDWAARNTPARLEWKVGGEIVSPAQVSVPTFIVLGQRDCIVPPLCGGALSKAIPNAVTIHPPAGHVGMVVGRQAKDHLWLPLAKWLRGL